MSHQHHKAAVTRAKNAYMFFADKKYCSPYLMEQFLKRKKTLQKKLHDGKGQQLDLNF